MANVVLIGTLDTKQAEYGWLRDELHTAGASTTLIDVGTFSDGAGIADVRSSEVAAAAGHDLERLRADDDRGAAMTAMSEGAAVVVTRLFARGELHAVLAVGGSSGSAVAGTAMQALPVGMPKLLVTTMAAGDVRPYVGAKDVTLMPSVVDVAGINQISRSTLGNAVAAAAGMASAHHARRQTGAHQADAPLIGASMFGLTTPAVDEARQRLTELGYEVLVFHATGAGGRAMESLAADGFLTGVLDLTTTELVGDLLGGVLSAGPGRLEAAGAAGVPQVVSVGALDMCNFGPRETVPDVYDNRTFVVHNPTVTLMRTTTEEMAELGRRIANKLRAATGPVEVYLPLGGVSGIDVTGGPFQTPRPTPRVSPRSATGWPSLRYPCTRSTPRSTTTGSGGPPPRRCTGSSPTPLAAVNESGESITAREHTWNAKRHSTVYAQVSGRASRSSAAAPAPGCPPRPPRPGASTC